MKRPDIKLPIRLWIRAEEAVLKAFLLVMVVGMAWALTRKRERKR